MKLDSFMMKETYKKDWLLIFKNGIKELCLAVSGQVYPQ
jgi:hypothetical protein